MNELNILNMKTWAVAELADQNRYKLPEGHTLQRIDAFGTQRKRVIKNTPYVADENLADLCEAVMDAIPGHVRIIPKESGRLEDMCLLDPDGNEVTKHIFTTASVWVWVEGDEWTRGVLHYGDVRDERTKNDSYGDDRHKPTFNVSARTIGNNKYASYSSRYNMKSAKNIKTAVRNAKKAFTRVAHTEVQQEFARTMYYTRSEVRNDASRAANAAMADVRRDDIVTELARSFRSCGELTLPQDILDKIIAADEAKRTFRALEQPCHGYFLQMERTVRDTQRLHVYELNNINLQQYDMLGGRNVIEYKTYDDITQVPADIVGKVSVLQMAESDKYIVGVGSRHQAQAYLLEATTDDAE